MIMDVYQSRVKNQYDLAIYQFGYEKCSSDQKFGPFKRDCFLLHFIVSGQGLYTIRNKTFHLKKGDCFLVVPDEDTYYEANKSDPYEYYWIGFRGVNAKRLMEDLGFYCDDNFVYHSNKQEYDILYKYMRNIVTFEEVDEKTYLYNLGHLYLILSLILQRNKKVADSVKNDVNVFNEICEYIAFNFSQQITIETLSMQFGFHRTSLYKLFKRNTGMSPSEYILNYRLDRAMQMVKNTTYLYKYISAECGFNDPTYFYKAFKRKFGRTPQQIRDLN